MESGSNQEAGFLPTLFMLALAAYGWTPGRAIAAEAPPEVIGEPCRSHDTAFRCLAMKYVVFTDQASRPVVSREIAVSNVKKVNSVWNQCKIGFQIEDFQAVDPDERSLRFRTRNYGELDEIRSEFADPRMLLVVTTGAWDRKGTLGNTGANAWTTLPGFGPFGAILERTVGAYANIIAHELGHYLNLSHQRDSTDLMNPIIYSTSTALTPVQCETARTAVAYHWKPMQR